MQFLVILACSVLFVCVFRNVIKRFPFLLYGIALLFTLSLLAFEAGWLPRGVGIFLIIAMRRGGLGMAFLTIVMFIGVLPLDGRPSKWLRPIRSELSIAGCILIAGHIMIYAPSFAFPFLAGNIARIYIGTSVAIALCLFVLLLLLGVTSLRVVKRHMDTSIWKAVQRLAYVFYGFVYLHLMLMIAPSAATGAMPALGNAIAYTAVVVSYAVLRIERALTDRHESLCLGDKMSSHFNPGLGDVSGSRSSDETEAC